jgi:hypothetical protein
MPLIGINTVQKQERAPSTFDQIAAGLQVAAQLLNTGVNAYSKLGPEADKAKADAAESAARSRYYDAQTQDYAGTKDLNNRRILSEIGRNDAEAKTAGLLGPLKVNQQMLELAKLSKDVQQPSLTPGQKSLDEAAAKDVNDFVLQGGAANSYSDLQKLDAAKQNLLSGNSNASGPFVGLIPKGVRDVVTPEGSSIQDDVESVVQNSLRQTLGAQFTENEGKRILSKAFNPRQSPEENARRVGILAQKIKEGLDAKKAAAQWFLDRGSMKDYPGKLPTAADFANIDYQQSAAPASAVKASPAQPSGGPQVGQIMDGHRYKGGDPSSPQSWELVK